MTVTTTTDRTNCVIESDVMAHIEDTRLFWVTRAGRQVQRSWNELTAREKQYQREAEARAAYVTLNNIYA